MMTRRTLDGALKCALRDFLREEWRATFGYTLVSTSSRHTRDIIHVLIFVMASVLLTWLLIDVNLFNFVDVLSRV